MNRTNPTCLRFAALLVTGVLVTTTLTAAEPPTQFEGYYSFGLGPVPKSPGLTVRTPQQWQAWLDQLPKLVTGSTRRLDQPNDDPLLTAKIDWTKQMVVVVRSRDDVPRIVSTEVRGKVLRVGVDRELDVAAHPTNWGSYSARIVARTPARVRFVAAPAKPAARQ